MQVIFLYSEGETDILLYTLILHVIQEHAGMRTNGEALHYRNVRQGWLDGIQFALHEITFYIVAMAHDMYKGIRSIEAQHARLDVEAAIVQQYVSLPFPA